MSRAWRAWKPGDPLPPWTARDEREKRAMCNWMFDRIDEAIGEKLDEAALTTTLKDFLASIEHGALEDAKSGDVTKLRRLAKPEWRPFINPKPLKPGEKYPRRLTDSSSYDARVHVARSVIVPLIRDICQKHYGKSRGYNANEI